MFFCVKNQIGKITIKYIIKFGSKIINGREIKCHKVNYPRIIIDLRANLNFEKPHSFQIKYTEITPIIKLQFKHETDRVEIKADLPIKEEV